MYSSARINRVGTKFPLKLIIIVHFRFLGRKTGSIQICEVGTAGHAHRYGRSCSAGSTENDIQLGHLCKIIPAITIFINGYTI